MLANTLGTDKVDLSFFMIAGISYVGETCMTVITT